MVYLTFVSPEESAKQKVGTEELFVITKSTHITVLSNFFVVLFFRQGMFNKDRAQASAWREGYKF